MIMATLDPAARVLLGCGRVAVGLESSEGLAGLVVHGGLPTAPLERPGRAGGWLLSHCL